MVGSEKILLALMTNKQQNIIIISVTSVIVLILIIIIVMNYKRMKQSLRGTFGSKKSYFTITELCASDTARKIGIDNTPSAEVSSRLQALIDNVLDPARREYGSYILVNSGYRCPALNTAVGGVKNSQHLTGEAADITAGSLAKNRKLFAILVAQGNYDQLIWEKPKNSLWIHVSYSASGNRRQILSYNGGKYTDIKNNWQTAIA